MSALEGQTAQRKGELSGSQLSALIQASKLLNATLDRDEVLRRRIKELESHATQ